MWPRTVGKRSPPPHLDTATCRRQIDWPGRENVAMADTVERAIDDVRRPRRGGGRSSASPGPTAPRSRARLRRPRRHALVPRRQPDQPGSTATRRCSSAGSSALLLQSLHPLAMAGVDQHSGYRGDPWGRLARTSRFLAVTTYGTAERARRQIAAVRAVHRRVTGIAPDGRPYEASDPHLLAWVHVVRGRQLPARATGATAAAADRRPRPTSTSPSPAGRRRARGGRRAGDGRRARRHAASAYRPELRRHAGGPGDGPVPRRSTRRCRCRLRAGLRADRRRRRRTAAPAGRAGRCACPGSPSPRPRSGAAAGTSVTRGDPLGAAGGRRGLS